MADKKEDHSSDDELMDFDVSEKTPSDRYESSRSQGLPSTRGTGKFSDRFRRTSSHPTPGGGRLWKERNNNNVDQSVNLMDRESFEKTGERSMVDIFMDSQKFGGSSSSSLDVIRYGGKQINGGARKWRLLVFLAGALIIIIVFMMALTPFGMESQAVSTEAPVENEVTELPPNEEVDTPAEEEGTLPPGTQPGEEEEEETLSAGQGGSPSDLNLEQVPDTDRLQAFQFIVVDQDVTDQAQLEIMGSPSKNALHWITQRDAAKLEIPGLDQVTTSNIEAARALLQRYALAVFYLSTQAKEPLPNNSEHTGGAGRQLQLQLEEVANHQAFERTWMSSEPVCQWHGVLCAEDSESVVGIRLPNHMLHGTIPRELLVGAAMPSLLSIDLSQNQLHGELPIVTQGREDAGQQLGVTPAKAALQVLLLGGNRLNGKLDAISGFLQLQELDLASNQLTGTFSSGLMDLRFLEKLSLQDNQLTGSLPEQFGGLTSLLQLRLGGNNFSGGLPETLRTLTKLQELSISGNRFTGTIPETIGEITTLQRIRLDGNSINGTVPTHFGHLTKLERLHLDGNNLTGVICQEVCALREDAALQFLVSQCRGITCNCCTDCF